MRVLRRKRRKVRPQAGGCGEGAREEDVGRLDLTRARPGARLSGRVGGRVGVKEGLGSIVCRCIIDWVGRALLDREVRPAREGRSAPLIDRDWSNSRSRYGCARSTVAPPL